MASAFSYAQAARGMSTTVVPASQSKSPSGSATPALAAEPTGINWADDAEHSAQAVDNNALPVPKVDEAVANGVRNQSSNPQPPGDSVISSPSVAASTSTKEDDASSVPNTSSESTWDNKSQASNAPDKPTHQGEPTSDKAKNKDRAASRALQDAPLPQVNVWHQRAEASAAKTKISPVAPAVKPLPSLSTKTPSSKSGSSKAGTLQKAKGDESDGGQADGGKSRDEDQPGRQSHTDVARQRKAGQNAGASRLLPVKDQESWPTPEDVHDEDRRKAQEKADRPDKDRTNHMSAKGKSEWVTLPYTPTAVFTTPMPNTGARRGGRGGSGCGGGGGRSSAHVGGHHGPASPNGLPGGERGPSSTSGDQSRHGRPEGGTQDPDSAESKRACSTGSNVHSSVDTHKSAAGSHAARPSDNEGPVASTHRPSNGQRNAASARSRANRRPEQSTAERRADDGSVSPNTTTTTTTSRRGSAAVHRAEERPRRKSFSQGDFQTAPTRSSGSDRRSGQYGPGRERGENRGRGGMRSRGGNHSYHNGHTGTFPSSQASLSMPRSSSSFDPNLYFTPFAQQQQQQRQLQQRALRNGRAQSLQTDALYARHPAGFQNVPTLAPLQTYVNAGYDFSMQPMSAVAYVSETWQLMHSVQLQLDYYFSVENLIKDTFMRERMDSQGFVFLTLIASFNRIKELTTDLSLIRSAIARSSVIDHKVGPDGKDRLRRRDGWQKWILAINERDPSAQNDGPAELYQPPDSSFAAPVGPRCPMQPFPGLPMESVPDPSHYAGFQPLDGFSQNISPDDTDPAMSEPAHCPNRRSSQLSLINVGAVPDFLPNTSSNAIGPETDAFSNDQTNDLTVILRTNQEPSDTEPASHTESSRTLSGGSVECIAQELPKDDAGGIGPETNGNGPPEAGPFRSDAPGRSTSPTTQSPTPTMRLFWVKDQDHPVQSESLPPNANVILYTKLYESALKQREAVPTGNCPYDMAVLYQFWSHFLIRNFNTSMYDEFRRLAFDDVARHSNIGMQCLIKYYSKTLSSHSDIRQRVARHYADILMADADNEGPALTQLRAAWRSGSVTSSNRRKIRSLMDDRLIASLDQ